MACVYPDACRYNTGIIMKASRQRLFILTLLFIVTAINYMDRANLAVAGSNIQNDFSLTPTQLGLLFSMFTWAYAASQIPVGYVLDRIGSRILYGGAIILWSIFTFMMGFASHHLFATATASFAMLLACRALIGVAEAPSFPSNTKIIATGSRTMNVPVRPQFIPVHNISVSRC
ncbi:hypothetical protein DR965_08400 [Salmonella enterica]|uniref:Major facilitator superfamily (MFS) profile domain-containing protein n=1 Tax=Salmonella enterica TaxID=28901 RepID=A0A5T9KWA6_SALER|nr:hypothetical protein [Salmonella enterica subsp. enterica serovar Alachua]